MHSASEKEELYTKLMKSYDEHFNTLQKYEKVIDEYTIKLNESMALWKAINEFEEGLYSKVFSFKPFIPKYIVEFNKRTDFLRQSNKELIIALKDIGKEMKAW